MDKMKILSSALKQIANNIDTNNSNATDEELDEIFDIINKTSIADRKLSKYQAAEYLNVSIPTFDNYVREGKIPPGRKQKGFKELFWYVKDIKSYKKK